MCQATVGPVVEDGTMCRAVSTAPGTTWGPASPPPMCTLTAPTRGVSPADGLAGPGARGTSPDLRVEAAQSVVLNAGAELTWNGYVRAMYEAQAAALSRQAEEMVRSGVMLRQEAAEWVTVQRNALVIATRDGKNTRLGKAVSELLKPREKLPSLDQLVAKKLAANPGQSVDEVYEAIIQGAGRTRASVNRVSFIVRRAGPAMIVIDVAFSAYLVYTAPPEQRGRVAARQVGQTAGGLSAGWAGARVGCGIGAAATVETGPGAAAGCLVVGAIFGLGFGVAGAHYGGQAGERVYEWVEAKVEWVN